MLRTICVWKSSEVGMVALTAGRGGKQHNTCPGGSGRSFTGGDEPRSGVEAQERVVMPPCQVPVPCVRPDPLLQCCQGFSPCRLHVRAHEASVQQGEQPSCLPGSPPACQATHGQRGANVGPSTTRYR